MFFKDEHGFYHVKEPETQLVLLNKLQEIIRARVKCKGRMSKGQFFKNLKSTEEYLEKRVIATLPRKEVNFKIFEERVKVENLARWRCEVMERKENRAKWIFEMFEKSGGVGEDKEEEGVEIKIEEMLDHEGIQNHNLMSIYRVFIGLKVLFQHKKYRIKHYKAITDKLKVVYDLLIPYKAKEKILRPQVIL